jgi:hypothetical protein
MLAILLGVSESQSDAIVTCNHGALPPHEVDELIFVGGDHTIEARVLTKAALEVGLRVGWMPLDSAFGQAALAAHGPGSVRLPLVIVGGRYCLQKPSFTEIEDCLETFRAGRADLTTGICQALPLAIERSATCRLPVPHWMTNVRPAM